MPIPIDQAVEPYEYVIQTWGTTGKYVVRLWDAHHRSIKWSGPYEFDHAKTQLVRIKRAASWI